MRLRDESEDRFVLKYLEHAGNMILDKLRTSVLLFALQIRAATSNYYLFVVAFLCDRNVLLLL